MSLTVDRPPIQLLHYARIRGHAAGKTAASTEAECPFKESTKVRQAWMLGFAEGRKALELDTLLAQQTSEALPPALVAPALPKRPDRRLMPTSNTTPRSNVDAPWMVRKALHHSGA